MVLYVEKGSGSGDEFDSSEMAAMSSSELKEYKEKNAIKKAAPVTPPSAPVAFPENSPVATRSSDDGKQLANFSAGSSGFDIGLLIAFPVIIGTLALFFVFPFVGAQLAGGSGPLPPM